MAKPLDQSLSFVGHPDDNERFAFAQSQQQHHHSQHALARDDSFGLDPSHPSTPHLNGSQLAPPPLADDRGRENGHDARDEAATDPHPVDSSTPQDKPKRRSSTTRICGRCGGTLSGQFVRALGDTFHLECFTCNDCGKIVASKFFPVPDQPPDQVPLCEKDYFSRLGLLCYTCDGALRGSYITALDRKYHIEHFTCSICPTVFGASDSYYEHDGDVYCHYHYSTKFAQRCNGCQTAILKQFVEIFRNGQNQQWHPECYMIHKFWNVRLHAADQQRRVNYIADADVTEKDRDQIKEQEEEVEHKVLLIWQTLSSFEEKSATCISDMLLHVSNGAYFDGVKAAKKFIVHVDLLFGAADDLDGVLLASTQKGLSFGREAKLLCKKIVAFFQLLTQSQNTGVRRLGVTQELLSLVTGLAHYLKLLIRICLQGSLKLEREAQISDGLIRFLNLINSLDDKVERDSAAENGIDYAAYVSEASDTCPICIKPVEDKCARFDDRVFHYQCMVCQKCNQELDQDLQVARWSASTQTLLCSNCASSVPGVEAGFFPVTKLRHYVHLLKVAHARLLANLRSSGALPHTSEDPNLNKYNSDQGHRVGTTADDQSRFLRSDSRSQSHTGTPGFDEPSGSSYEQTLGDIKRLRSTRLDRHLSTSMRQSRASRVLDGSTMTDPSFSHESGAERRQSLSQSIQTAQQRKSLSGPGQLGLTGSNAIALDDIPRIVAAEQAKEQRPNASKFARRSLFDSEPKARLVNGHRRDYGDSKDLEKLALADGQTRPKRYFSELTALEYFIVRHVAVLSIEPLLEGTFNQEELLELIETKRTTFWGKLFKNDKAKVAGKKKGIFGVALDVLIERDGVDSTDGVGPGALRIPAMVQDIISAMRTMDMSVEGVFRKNGNIRRLKELAEEIDIKGGDGLDLNKEGPVQIAALLKKFLRALPDPVLSFKLHKLFIASQKIADEDKRKRIIHLTCCLLPKVHRDTMEVLFAFLTWVSSFSTVDEESGSKMDIHNIATVIAPNILYSNGKNPGMDDSLLAIEAVHAMIEDNETFCEVPEDIQSILNDSSLFEQGADLTTKDILKRFGDIAKTPQTTITHPDMAQAADRQHEMGSVMPVVTGVDREHASWPQESSVRHVQDQGSYGTQTGPAAWTTHEAFWLPPGRPSYEQPQQPPQQPQQQQQQQPPQQQQHQQQQQQQPQILPQVDGALLSKGLNGPVGSTPASLSIAAPPARHAQHPAPVLPRQGPVSIPGAG